LLHHVHQYLQNGLYSGLREQANVHICYTTTRILLHQRTHFATPLLGWFWLVVGFFAFGDLGHFPVDADWVLLVGTPLRHANIIIRE
jgi:hypothetical protein